MSRRRRLVYDTNVIVSAVLTPGGICEQLLHMVSEREVTHVVSPAILNEYQRVLTRDSLSRIHRWTPAQVSALVESIAEHSVIVDPQEVPVIIESDPSDNVFVAAAVTGSAEFIVSGDQHLLGLRSHRGIEVLRPHEMFHFLSVDTTN